MERVDRGQLVQGAHVPHREVVSLSDLAAALEQGFRSRPTRGAAYPSQPGFTYNPGVHHENAACMLVGDRPFVMLLGRDTFAEYSMFADRKIRTDLIVASPSMRRAPRIAGVAQLLPCFDSVADALQDTTA